MSDYTHFERVRLTPIIQDACARHRLECNPYARGAHGPALLHNDGLKFMTEAWRVPCPDVGGRVTAIDVHLEARRPGEIHLDVEVYPYEGSIHKDQEREAKLRPQLALKARLLRELRDFLLADPVCKTEFNVNTKRLAARGETTLIP